LGREGPESKGEQPRPLAKIPKLYLSASKEFCWPLEKKNIKKLA